MLEQDLLNAQRLVQLMGLVGAALARLETHIPVPTSEEYNNVTGCLWWSYQMLQQEAINATVPVASVLGEHALRLLRERFHNLQSISILSLATLLDQRHKAIGVFSKTNSDKAV